MPGFLLVEFPIPRKAIYRDRGLTPSPRAANLRLAAPRPSGLLYPAPLHMIYPGRGSSSLRDSSHSFRIAGRLIAADFECNIGCSRSAYRLSTSRLRKKRVFRIGSALRAKPITGKRIPKC